METTNLDWRSQLAAARSRTPMSHNGHSGSPIDRVVLASGETVVVKRSSPQTDVFAKLTRDNGRVIEMWTSGIFDRMPAAIDHATLAVLPDQDGWLIVMRDVADSLVADDRVLSRDEIERILSAVDAMHTAFLGQRMAGMCPFDDYLTAYLPRAADLVPRMAASFAQAREAFTAAAAPDIVDLVARGREDPGLFERLFARCEKTLIHGDLFPPNIGFCDERLVLIDWSFATNAPAAFEIAFFLLWSDTGWCATLGVPRDEILDTYREIAGDRCDATTLSIGIISAFALCAPALSERPEALDWWTQRVRQELKRINLP